MDMKVMHTTIILEDIVQSGLSRSYDDATGENSV